MSLKKWFGFPVSPENLTSSPVICIGVVGTVVSGAVLLIKYKKSQAELKSNDEETEVLKTQTAEQLQKTQAELKSKDEKIEELKNELEENVDRVQSLSLKNESLEKDLQTLKTELEDSQSELKDKTNEVMKLRTEKNRSTENEKELQTMKLRIEDKNKEMPINESPSKAIKADVLMLHDENEQNELLQIVEQLQKTEAELKRKDEEIEELKTQLEKLQWLRNDTLKGMDESQRKFTKLTLAIKRMEKLEEIVGLHRIQSLCLKNESLEKDLQTLKTELEASKSEV
ncbi:WEB family protein At4g27595, chloroplastic-like [Oreochromis niloticus]|uniref:WEB family protein At4g27595, chloroplastic-like n=1 Tax=Oreochromis niloticus TaxID=8128 RepID=UPI000904F8CB|nr:WEB family protein At4g27595, chloroplastic-like [Oreochromis niloticus]